MIPRLILIAHNLRSAHNVGSLLRTADGLAVEKVILTGYTPYPMRNSDGRLPHLAQKIDHQIAKTALGAERLSSWEQVTDITKVIDRLKADGFSIIGLEQTPDSESLTDFVVPDDVAVIVGREVEGLETEILKVCDSILEIPMLGHKESFNVVQTAAMALYHMRYKL